VWHAGGSYVALPLAGEGLREGKLLQIVDDVVLLVPSHGRSEFPVLGPPLNSEFAGGGRQARRGSFTGGCWGSEPTRIPIVARILLGA
jgi:hypothetical protein